MALEAGFLDLHFPFLDYTHASKPYTSPQTWQEEESMPMRNSAYLYCCGESRGLLLPLLLTCSTVLLTSS